MGWLTLTANREPGGGKYLDCEFLMQTQSVFRWKKFEVRMVVILDILVLFFVPLAEIYSPLYSLLFLEAIEEHRAAPAVRVGLSSLRRGRGGAVGGCKLV